MPFIRSALAAAAVAVVFVTPSVASAQAPAPKPLPVAQSQIDAIKVGIDVRNKQIDALRAQIAAFSKLPNGAIVVAALRPRLDDLVRANQVAQKQLAGLVASQSAGSVDAGLKLAQERAAAQEKLVKAQVDGLKQRNDKLAALNQQLKTMQADPKADAKKVDEMRAQLEKMTAEAQLEMLKLQALVDQRNQMFEMVSSVVKSMADTQQQIVSNIRG